MIDRMRYELLLNGRPALTGAAQGLACLAVASVLVGAMPFVATSGVAALAWCAFAYGRPPAWRLGLLLAVGCGIDALSGAAIGRTLPALATAMLAASFASGVNAEERWSAGHGIFALVAVIGWYAGAVVFAAVGPDFFGPMPPVAMLFMSILLLLISTACIATARMVRILRGTTTRRVSLAGTSPR